jgi:hypothetical protein
MNVLEVMPNELWKLHNAKNGDDLRFKRSKHIAQELQVTRVTKDRR